MTENQNKRNQAQFSSICGKAVFTILLFHILLLFSSNVNDQPCVCIGSGARSLSLLAPKYAKKKRIFDFDVTAFLMVNGRHTIPPIGIMKFFLHPYRRIFLQNDINIFPIILFLFDCTKQLSLFCALRYRANFTSSLLKTLFFAKRHRFFEKFLISSDCTKPSKPNCASCQSLLLSCVYYIK